MATQTKTEDSWGKYDILKVAKYITIASAVVTLIAGIFVVSNGLNYGVDFSGGIEMQIKFAREVDAHRVRTFMADEGYPHANVQALGTEKKDLLLHIETEKTHSDDEANAYIKKAVAKIKAGFSEKFKEENAEVLRVDTVGPQVGAELRRNGILAGFYALLLILIYIGLRFDYRFAPAAVFCLFHDAVITMGVYSLMGWEFTVQTMAGILTIIGYSLNDTIVIFDRIRENQTIHRGRDLYWISNLSINETLSRTVLTYVATYLTVGAMFFFADGVIHDFARTMMIGMFLGAYSTVYVATPLMLLIDWWHDLRTGKTKAKA